MRRLYLYLVRNGISLSSISTAVHNQTEEGSKLRLAFLHACMAKGLDADSPHAEEIRRLFESYGWKWMLEERDT